MTESEWIEIFKQAEAAAYKRGSEVRSMWDILAEELFRRLEKYEVKR